ncbi:MAG: response regulator [Candidatus Omnitrophota bacterium]
MNDDKDNTLSMEARIFQYALAEALISSGVIDAEELKHSIIKWRKLLNVDSKEDPLAFLAIKAPSEGEIDSPKSKISAKSTASAPSASHPPLPKRRRIMIVDDVLYIREMVKTTLVMHGYVVAAEADNGREAIQIFQELRPDIVLTDIEMKGMNGLELLREIRKIDQTAPVIIMTGNPNKDYVKEAFGAGMTDFIVKPIDMMRLLSVLRKVDDL